MCRQPALRVLPGTLPSVPAATGTIPPDGCVLGIDVGSTSTDLVLTGRDGTLIDYQYLRTAGDPEGGCAGALDAIHERFGPVSFLAVGVTGSGRGAHRPSYQGQTPCGMRSPPRPGRLSIGRRM